MFQKLKHERPIKRLFFLLSMVITVLPVWGGQVDENTARKVAVHTLSRSSALRSSSDSTLQKAPATEKSLQLLYLSSSSGNSKSGNTNSSMRASQANETVYFYVFGAENNKGFVIVAGDDRITPVLGYSETNRFSADDMPPNLQWWLGEYAKQIQFAIDNDIKPSDEVKQQWVEYVGINDNGKEE